MRVAILIRDRSFRYERSFAVIGDHTIVQADALMCILSFLLCANTIPITSSPSDGLCRFQPSVGSHG